MNLKLSLEKAVATYNSGDANVKKLLVDLYGPEHFITDIKERVTGYEAACKILGRTPLTISQFQFLGDEQAKKQFARHKIATGIEAINEKWVADWDNENQHKHYVYMTNKKRGFGSVVDFFYFSTAGSGLYIESNQKALIIAKVFREEYIEYLF